MMLLLTIFTYHLVNIKPASSLITIVSAILFTYHLVNIKLNKDKKDEAKTKKFTYHLVNIKLPSTSLVFPTNRNLHTT